MSDNLAVLNTMKELTTKFAREFAPHVEAQHRGNLLVVGMFIVGHAAKESGIAEATIDEFVDRMIELVGTSGGNDRRAYIENTLGMLAGRSAARGFESKLSGNTPTQDATEFFEGLAGDLLEIGGIRKPAKSQLDAVGSLLAASIKSMRAPLEAVQCR